MGRIWEAQPRRIVIFRALKLGDMLCAVPAFRAIRSYFAGAEIVLVALPWARSLVARYRPYLDGFREFPGYPGLPEREPDLERLARFFDGLRGDRFDLAIQLHGSGAISNEVTSRLGARTTAGFYEPGRFCPNPTTFYPYPSRGLELRRLLRLLEHLGVPPRGEYLEFPIADQERALVRRLLQDVGIGACRYVCVHGGASVAERRWPVGRFAMVADGLAKLGYAVVLTGSQDDAEVNAAIARSMRFPAVDLAGKTPLGVLAALLDEAQLLVCNDTGVSHVADARCVPSVVISTGDNPARWAPVDRLRHRVLCHESGVTPAEVLAEAEDLLRSQFAGTA